MDRHVSILRALGWALKPGLLAASMMAHGGSSPIRIDKPPEDGIGCFGTRVELAGRWLWIVDPCATHADLWSTGIVYQYVRHGSGWVLDRRMISPRAEANGRFGEALSANDAGHVAIGAPGEPRGAAYMVSVESAHIQRVDFPVTSPADAVWGYAVARTRSTMWTAAPTADCSVGVDCGIVASFDGIGPPLSAPQPVSGMTFGYSMASDATRILVGAPGSRTAYLYTAGFIGAQVHTATFTATSPTSVTYAESLALQGDWVAIGAPGDAAASRPGQVWVYQKVGEFWFLRRVISSPDEGRRAGFGRSVALAKDLLWVGATADFDGAGGALYTYRLEPDGVITEAGVTLGGQDTTGWAFGAALAGRGATWIVGIPYARDAGSFDGSGAIVVSTEDFVFYSGMDR
ncbi:hypothetical protein ACQQ2N_06550 [Dokdonella sp. MW10]|uniref:hypothetical protein n=1 Tax=Dokdonella sp. MW10 TaxID=2992926 RepID=UPI003F7D8B10